MALMKCPECGQEVSDKAPACIHCGFPLQCTEKIQPTSELYQVILVSMGQNTIAPLRVLRETIPNLGLVEAKNMIDSLPCLILKNIPLDKAELIQRNFQAVGAEILIQPSGIRLAKDTDDAPIMCPKCKSTAISTGQRGFSFFTGFIGSHKTVNRCGKCGYSWQPRTR